MNPKLALSAFIRDRYSASVLTNHNFALGGPMAALPALPLVQLRPLDALLDAIAITLQIKPDQFDDAERRYLEVGKWLSAPGSKLAHFKSRIYAQGSMRLKTTVRPREARGEEYDLDIVFEIDDATIGAMQLYRLVLERLRENPDYRDRIVELNRCIRLDYAGFHLDILPARRDPFHIDGCIEIPDCDLREWQPSNPNGYANWFELRCTIARGVIRASAQQPLPEPEPADLLVSLRRVVQLMKRRRDNRFGDDGGAPRSVVLTTLAGDFYNGRQSTSDVLDATLAGIEARTAAEEAAGRRLVVLNPSHPEEDFSERWDAEPEEYRLFRKFIGQFRMELAQLRSTEGLDDQGRLLNEMFGQALGTQAVERYMRQMRQAMDVGLHRFKGPAIIVGGEEGRKPRAHTFHHGS